MGKSAGTIILRTMAMRAILLLCVAALTGCAALEELAAEADTASTAAHAQADAGPEADPAADGDSGEDGPTETAACESYEEEVEPGVCGYIVDCQDAVACEMWQAGMIRDMDEWFGDLTYSEEWDVDEKESGKEPEAIAAYAVAGDRLDLEPENGDEQYYAWLWERFAWIIPSEWREMIASFEVYDHADVMAYVVQNEDDYEKWTYAANQVQATYETERVMTDIHEFGHLLSLNAGQVDPYAEADDCDTYMLDEGCPAEDAYIYRFYEQFWEQGEDSDDSHYVTEYAMSSVYEDFAESWSYFVMTPRPAGDSVAERKVAFFYDYEELVNLKASILARAASWMDRNIAYE